MWRCAGAGAATFMMAERLPPAARGRLAVALVQGPGVSSWQTRRLNSLNEALTVKRDSVAYGGFTSHA